MVTCAKRGAITDRPALDRLIERLRLSGATRLQIRHLLINRYRGIASLEWRPSPGWNCLVGPGDSSKTTILLAISLLLAPYTVGPRSQYEYYRRDVAKEFEIEATIGALDLKVLAEASALPSPWGLRDGNLVPIPLGNDEPVLRVRVRGTEDLEAVYEMLLPSGDVVSFPTSLRKRFNLFQVREDAAAPRAFRFAPGSALGRDIDNTGMRRAVHDAVSDAAGKLSIPETAGKTIGELQLAFDAAGLPPHLALGLVPVPTGDLLSIVALHSGESGSEAIPLSHFGSGTREMAALVMLTRAASAGVILTVDEVERGLEPHRQRQVCDRLVSLIGAAGQIFSTTHSPIVIRKALEKGSV